MRLEQPGRGGGRRRPPYIPHLRINHYHLSLSLDKYLSIYLYLYLSIYLSIYPSYRTCLQYPLFNLQSPFTIIYHLLFIINHLVSIYHQWIKGNHVKGLGRSFNSPVAGEADVGRPTYRTWFSIIIGLLEQAGPTRDPSWGHPRCGLGAVGAVLEPFRGHF